MINVLHINYSDIIGARFNGFYMLEGNDDESVSFSMAVWEKKSQRNDVYELPPYSKLIKKIVWFLLHVLYKFGNDHLTSIAGYYLLSRTDYYKKADVVHLHIIHGDSNISFRVIGKICKEKKVVWTFHDQWPISGGCIHPFECNGVSIGCSNKCPHPRYKNAFFGDYMPCRAYKVRKNVYEQSKFDIVVSTNWMKDKVLSNPATSRKKIHIVPFGLDTSIFKNRGKEAARKKLNIPQDNFVVLLRNTGTDPMKGLQYSIEGILKSEIERKTTVVTIDKIGGLEAIGKKYNLLETGWQDTESLIDILSAVDVLLMPSLQESFGLMSVEAMSCGVPVIVAEGTALPDVIKDGEGGIVIPARSASGIAKALNNLGGDRDYLVRLSSSARNRAVQKYELRDCINQHINIYKNLFVNI